MDATQVIIRPVVSEKSYVLAAADKYTFRVHPDAHKTQIRQAVEELFPEVKVIDVRTMSVKSKPKRRGWTSGRSRTWKKAVVQVRPGDTINIAGLNIVVVTADGEHVSSIPGIKPEPNANCAKEPKWTLDQSENPRSVGFLLRFGKFSFLDLGDLTKPKEINLVCPNNPLGNVSLFLVSHHGLDQSNSKSLVDAIHPRAAIMNNGSHKGGSPEAWQTVSETVGPKNLFMLHTAEGSDAAHNSAEGMIANPKGDGEGHYFKVAARKDGTFSITNSRTSETREFSSK